MPTLTITHPSPRAAELIALALAARARVYGDGTQEYEILTQIANDLRDQIVRERPAPRVAGRESVSNW